MKSLFLFLLVLPVFVSGQVIETIAGNGVAGYSGDGGAAISAELNQPNSIRFDRVGNMYIADWLNNVIRKIDRSGTITTVAGNGYGSTTPGIGGYAGDGGPATAAELNGPVDVAFDDGGNMYITDQGNSMIRKVDPTGIITRVAGTGTLGYNGDGIPATAAQINHPGGIVFDTVGDLYIADEGNSRIRKISPSGIITTIAGTGIAGYNADGISATSAKLWHPFWLAFSPSRELYFADGSERRIRKIDMSGIISTVAGTGMTGSSGDGGPATAANIGDCEAVAFDNLGNLYFSNLGICSVRKVNTAGIISTIAGNDTCAFGGDGGSATDAQINVAVVCSAVDAYGNIYIADPVNNRIREIVYDSTAAVGDVNKTPNHISIYPNPAQNEITIKSTTAIESVEVVNMMGQVVACKSSKQKEVLLDIRSLPTGVYFVKVSGPDGYRDGGRFVKE